MMSANLDALVAQLPPVLRALVTPLYHGLSEQERAHISALVAQVQLAHESGDTDTLLRLRAEYEPKIPGPLRPLLDKYLSDSLLPPKH
jgi:hypothetical protein